MSQKRIAAPQLII